MNKKSLLVVVVGPTAVGKTAVTIDLAGKFESEIISADSRQFYKEMEIGTAKPDAAELGAVKHHFINSHTIKEDYDAGSFANDVEELLPALFETQEVQFMVGGSGLYITSVCDGLDDMPPLDTKIRQALKDEFSANGLEPLLRELQEKDLVYYHKVDHSNKQRIIRALEVIRQSNKPYTSFRKNTKIENRSFDILKIGLELDRAILYDRINERMDVMIANGLFEEAESLYPFKEKNALQTVGYKEIFDFMDGVYDKEEAIRLLKRNSRRYAKRQMTWFKKDEEVHWFNPSEIAKISDLINASHC